QLEGLRRTVQADAVKQAQRARVEARRAEVVRRERQLALLKKQEAWLLDELSRAEKEARPAGESGTAGEERLRRLETDVREIKELLLEMKRLLKGKDAP